MMHDLLGAAHAAHLDHLTTRSTVAADLRYVEDRIASSEVLCATRHYVFVHGDQVSVEVEGSHWEARAWRAAFNGRICPSHVDRHGVRRQLVLATHVEIQVVEHGRRQDNGGAAFGVLFIVACVGLFLFGFSHAVSTQSGGWTPDGRWIAGIAFVGALVLLLATAVARYSRSEKRRAAAGTRRSQELAQDTSGEHYQDGA